MFAQRSNRQNLRFFGRALSIIFIVDIVPGSFIGKFSYGDVDQFGSLIDVAPGIFQGIHENFLFKTCHSILKGQGKGLGLGTGLEGCRQVGRSEWRLHCTE